MSTEQNQAAPPGDAGFIDQAELLRRLPVSRRTIQNWRTSGKIPSIKIGRRVLFCWENVAEALRRLERGVVP
jgi:excisionase family DNA binding protein